MTAMELENIRESGDSEQERVIKHVAAMSNAGNKLYLPMLSSCSS